MNTEKLKKLPRNILFGIVIARWLDFLFVSRIIWLNKFVNDFYVWIRDGAVGRYLASFRLLETFPFLKNLWLLVWKASFLVIPFIIAIVWFYTKNTAEVRKWYYSFRAWVQRLHPRYATETHYILRVLDTENKNEYAVDISVTKIQEIADGITVEMRDDKVFLVSRNSEDSQSMYMEPKEWYKTDNIRYVKLLIHRI